MIIDADDRVIVTDHSVWDTMLRPQELIDGGVTDVILKAGSGVTPDIRFQINGEKVARWHGLRLHAYWWDDPTVNASAQAQYAAAFIKASGLPVRTLWGDVEQWWGSWDAWRAAKSGKLAWKDVPRLKAVNLNAHFRTFARVLSEVWPACGLYVGRGFITTYVPYLKEWLGLYNVWFPAWGRQPTKPRKMEWSELTARWLPDYDPFIKDTGLTANNIVGHQFTGDRCLLPGAYQDNLGIKRKPMDVSVFRRSFMEGAPIVPEDGLIEEDEPPTTTEYIFLGAHLWVRRTPTDNAPLIDSLTRDQRVNVLEIIDGGWARLAKPAGWVRYSWLTKL